MKEMIKGFEIFEVLAEFDKYMNDVEKKNSLEKGICEISEKIERLRVLKKKYKKRELFFDEMIKKQTLILVFLKNQKDISYNEAMSKYFKSD